MTATKDLLVQLRSLGIDLVEALWELACVQQVSLFVLADQWLASEERVIEWIPEGIVGENGRLTRWTFEHFHTAPIGDRYLSGYIPLSLDNIADFTVEAADHEFGEAADLGLLGRPGDEVIYRLKPPRNVALMQVWVTRSDVEIGKQAMSAQGIPEIRSTGQSGSKEGLKDVPQVFPTAFLALLDWAHDYVPRRIGELGPGNRETVRSEVIDKAKDLKVPNAPVAGDLAWLWKNPYRHGGRPPKRY